MPSCRRAARTSSPFNGRRMVIATHCPARSMTTSVAGGRWLPMYRARWSTRCVAPTPRSRWCRSPRRLTFSPNASPRGPGAAMGSLPIDCCAPSMMPRLCPTSPLSTSAASKIARARSCRSSGELDVTGGARPAAEIRRTTMTIIATIDQLEAIYGQPNEASTVKVADRITPQYRVLIDKSPFAALATCGPEGLDCSPRGDLPGLVRVHDETTLMMPDRRGNNRVDSLRNIVRDPRIALLFLIPGSGSTLRVNGHARVSADADLLASFKVDGKAPRTVIVMTVDEIYFQCARAIVRSDLWNPDRRVDPKSLPTPGQILAEMSENRVGGEDYDRAWPERARQTMW